MIDQAAVLDLIGIDNSNGRIAGILDIIYIHGDLPGVDHPDGRRVAVNLSLILTVNTNTIDLLLMQFILDGSKK